MRVLVMSHAWLPDTGAGAQTTGHDLMVSLVKAGHQVDVLLSQNRGAITTRCLDGVVIHPYLDTGDPFRWFGTQDNYPHVVVSHLEGTLRAAVLAKMHNVPHVHLLHNDMPLTRYQVKEGPSDLVVYNTEWMRDIVEDWLIEQGAPLPNSVVVHPPVHRELYRTLPGELITQVNLFTGTKNPQIFYEMARRLPDKKFLGVLGAYGDQLIMEMPNVELIGPFEADEMRDKVYARTKILLMPSDYESYGRCAVEASCSGIPVLAGETAGLIEALAPDGIHLGAGDHDGWERELRKMLTVKGWQAASRRAKRVAANLTTDEDLARFVKEMEAVARVRTPMPIPVVRRI